MNIMTRRRLVLFAAIWVILLTAFSVYSLVIKRDALQFQTRDYNYFIEQAARLADPHLTNHYALNIEGYNFLGLSGTEGVRNIYHALHAEYFRYTYTILYGIIPDTLPIYIFYCLVFFAPILYYALLPSPNRDRWKQVVLFALLYALFPAGLSCVTADLRPRILFISAWALVILAVFYRRPFWEKLLFFVLLLGIREEGILLGVAVIVLNALRMKVHPGWKKQTVVLSVLDLLAFGLFVAFMVWGRYTQTSSVGNPFFNLYAMISGLKGVTAVGLLVIAGMALFIWIKRRSAFNLFMQLLVYLGMIVVNIPVIISEFNKWLALPTTPRPLNLFSLYLSATTNWYDAIAYYFALLLLVLLWEYTSGRVRSVYTGVLAVLCVFFAVTDSITVPQALIEWRQTTTDAQLVWNFKNSHDR